MAFTGEGGVDGPIRRIVYMGSNNIPTSIIRY
jgi:hypothetical protein